VEQGKRKRKKRTQTIEPFNRDIDEHDMHLKHKEEKKQQTEMHNFFFYFQTTKRQHNKH
jgi:hypothetical protein